MGLWIVLFFTLSQSHAAQIVTPVQSGHFVAPQDSFQYSARYTISAPETDTETGLGLRIHYDSSQLIPGTTALFSLHAQPVGEISVDESDYDADPLTDRYFIVAWVDFEAQWPGIGTLPLNLLTTTFTTTANFSGSTAVRLSASGTAKNTAFNSRPQYICAQPELSILTTDSVSENAGVMTFEVQATQPIPAVCEDLNVVLTATGTASLNEDYLLSTQTAVISAGSNSTLFHVQLVDDDRPEPDETLTLHLQSDDHYSLSDQAAATVTILNDDAGNMLPVVDLSVAKTSLTEGSSGSLLVFVSRSGDTATALDVLLELSGTLQAGIDYQPFPAFITIPAGAKQAFAVLILKDDAEKESDQTLTIRIGADARYQRGSFSTVALSIIDDELNQNTQLPIPSTSTQTPSLPRASIPTLNEWVLRALSLLLGLLALSQLKWKEP